MSLSSCRWPLFWYTAKYGVEVAVEVDQKVVITTFTGEINDEDILGIRSLIRSHPNFDASFSEILDFSGSPSLVFQRP